jgi:hypothetical protein
MAVLKYLDTATGTYKPLYGPPGPKGDPGPAGPAGGSYLHVQAVPAAVWNITHGLGFYPNVTAVDSTRREVWCETEYPSTTTVRLTFSAALGGEAYLS